MSETLSKKKKVTPGIVTTYIVFAILTPPMFGPDYLVAPVLYEGMRERSVYLPEGKWEDTRDGKVTDGGQTVTASAPIDSIPVYRKVEA